MTKFTDTIQQLTMLSLSVQSSIIIKETLGLRRKSSLSNSFWWKEYQKQEHFLLMLRNEIRFVHSLWKYQVKRIKSRWVGMIWIDNILKRRFCRQIFVYRGIKDWTFSLHAEVTTQISRGICLLCSVKFFNKKLEKKYLK